MNPYRFHQFHMPTHGAFDNPQLRWITFVGEFILPIVKGENNLLYWFCNHDGDKEPNYQFCFIADDFKLIEAKIEAQKKALGITTLTAPTEDARIEFAGSSRFLAKNKIGTVAVEDTRAELVLRLLHSTCALLIDQLIKDGPYWRLEGNNDGQNPLGNSFESILHLVSNISQAEFDVFLYHGTAWMGPKAAYSLRCNL